MKHVETDLARRVIRQNGAWPKPGCDFLRQLQTRPGCCLTGLCILKAVFFPR